VRSIRLQRLLLGDRADDPELMTEVELTVVSQLAEGSDRLVIDYVFDYAARRGQSARLEVVLPDGARSVRRDSGL
jgi:hypothetical protein